MRRRAGGGRRNSVGLWPQGAARIAAARWQRPVNAIFHYQAGTLHAEQVPVAKLASLYGTPLYIYSATALRAGLAAYQAALSGIPHRICYSVKANGNLAVLRCIAEAGGGFDVVSGGELARVLRAGGKADTVVFSGAGKTAQELDEALQAGIFCFNVESADELELLSVRAQVAGKRAKVALRINPDIATNTHPHITTGLAHSKFGIAASKAPAAARRATELESLDFLGFSCHIGSQIMSLEPLGAALDQLLALRETLRREHIEARLLNLGGGLGVNYRPDDAAPEPTALGAALAARIGTAGVELVLEPGRSVAAAAGVLVSRILYVKTTADGRRLAVADAGMNDFLRPALYDSWHPIDPVTQTPAGAATHPPVDILGPVCESADVLGRERRLAVAPDALIAIGMAGAYGASMASRYNSRPQAAEVLVSGHRHHLARAREQYDEMMRGESAAPPDGTPL